MLSSHLLQRPAAVVRLVLLLETAETNYKLDVNVSSLDDLERQIKYVLLVGLRLLL